MGLWSRFAALFGFGASTATSAMPRQKKNKRLTNERYVPMPEPARADIAAPQKVYKYKSERKRRSKYLKSILWNPPGRYFRRRATHV